MEGAETIIDINFRMFKVEWTNMKQVCIQLIEEGDRRLRINSIEALADDREGAPRNKIDTCPFSLPADARSEFRLFNTATLKHNHFYHYHNQHFLSS